MASFTASPWTFAKPTAPAEQLHLKFLTSLPTMKKFIKASDDSMLRSLQCRTSPRGVWRLKSSLPPRKEVGLSGDADKVLEGFSAVLESMETDTPSRATDINFVLPSEISGSFIGMEGAEVEEMRKQLDLPIKIEQDEYDKSAGDLLRVPKEGARDVAKWILSKQQEDPEVRKAFDRQKFSGMAPDDELSQPATVYLEVEESQKARLLTYKGRFIQKLATEYSVIASVVYNPKENGNDGISSASLLRMQGNLGDIHAAQSKALHVFAGDVNDGE